MDTKKMTAPCGLACWACGVYKDNITDEVAKHAAEMLQMNPEDVACNGCRSGSGCSFEAPLTNGKGCPTKTCVEAKGLHNCSECTEFPCDNLMPGADMAAQIPHNTKLYNLSRIKLIGLDAWSKEAPEIQQRYFTGSFVYGTGPVINEQE